MTLAERSGLDPLVELSTSSQFKNFKFRALCFRQSLASMGYSLSKAIVKRLLATQSLPVQPPFLRPAMGSNRSRYWSGPADFVFPPERFGQRSDLCNTCPPSC